ncbi:PDR/VanB family oxidoreductase [Salinisphaera sp. T31B1]|uniref:PDR/VanB family oxidoreductase n=1 Tax=Salinisphaera sp. T31B1 TaxID=727963 RepID=UPI00333E7D5E
MKLVVDDRVDDRDGVVVLTLRHPRKPRLPAWRGGAHVDMHLPDGKIRQYSLCGDPGDRTVYRIAVQKESAGRGGSCWIHDHVCRGDIVHLSAPRTNFALHDGARRHVFVAGGIGVTPLLAMARQARHRGDDFIFHYCAARRERAALLTEVDSVAGDRLRTYFSDEQRLDVKTLFEGRTTDDHTHLYGCGPARLTDAIRDAAHDAGWPEERVHFEVFQPPLDDDFKPEPFEVVVASSGERVPVPADRTALSVLRDHGYSMPSSCELGVCGACICEYRDGQVIHRDSVLSLADRQHRMTPCISRARCRVTLDI